MSSEKSGKEDSKQGSDDNTKSSSDNGLEEENWQNVKLNEQVRLSDPNTLALTLTIKPPQGDPETASDGASERLRESPEVITEQDATEEFAEIDSKDVPREENLDANGKPYGGFVCASKPMRYDNRFCGSV